MPGPKDKRDSNNTISKSTTIINIDFFSGQNYSDNVNIAMEKGYTTFSMLQHFDSVKVILHQLARICR